MSQNTPGRDYDSRDFYIYASSALALVSGATASESVNIQANSDFILHKLAFFAVDKTTVGVQTHSARVLPEVTVQMTDQGSGRQLFQRPVLIPSTFGSGELPFILPVPRRFIATSTLEFSYLNISPAVEYDIYLSLIGLKIAGR